MTMIYIFLLSLSLHLVFSYTTPDQCSIYCGGEILKTIQESGIYVDSKTFVDMPMMRDAEDIIKEFKKLTNYSKETLSQFLSDHFFNCWIGTIVMDTV